MFYIFIPLHFCIIELIYARKIIETIPQYINYEIKKLRYILIKNKTAIIYYKFMASMSLIDLWQHKENMVEVLFDRSHIRLIRGEWYQHAVYVSVGYMICKQTNKLYKNYKARYSHFTFFFKNTKLKRKMQNLSHK